MEIERRQYPRQFKDEAIRLVLEQGYTCGKAGEQLGVPAKTLANWVRPLRKEKRLAQIAVGVGVFVPQHQLVHVTQPPGVLHVGQTAHPLFQYLKVLRIDQLLGPGLPHSWRRLL